MVTVIIPCYNGADVIDRSIESVYIQEYEDIELIVVDDGSTDQSKEHILSWKSRFDDKGFKLIYICQENRGPGGAVDAGLKYVTGKYLSLLDADDYLLPGSIKKRADFLDIHPDYVGVRTDGWELKGEKKQLFKESKKNKETTDYFHALLFDNALNWAGSYMVRTDILFSIYPEKSIYPSRFGQHMQILLPTAYRRKFGYIDEPLMVYVIQQESHSHSADKQAQLEKADRNFYGYIEIYLKVINSMTLDSKERDEYLRQINSWKYRHECDKALHTNDKKKLKENLVTLEKLTDLTINEKIKYYRLTQPVTSFVYRCIRKINALLK